MPQHEPDTPQDPQSEPGTFCPRNRFGIRDYSELQVYETAASHRRQVELDAQGVNGVFDTGHLRKIHWWLFRDVFPWAGELRLTHMSKVGGASFGFPQHIASALGEALGELRAESLLRGLDHASFARRAAHYLGHINAIHPFREGNGRTQREFVRQLAINAGFAISWVGMSKEENTVASILSHTRGDNSGLVTIIDRAMVQGVLESGVKDS
ncbi:MAG TPA: Fic family protein [Acidobacteriaceae bacterium]